MPDRLDDFRAQANGHAPADRAGVSDLSGIIHHQQTRGADPGADRPFIALESLIEEMATIGPGIYPIHPPGKVEK